MCYYSYKIYCKVVNDYCYCTGNCNYCPDNNYKNQPIYYPQQFNYECPDCHGKFNSAVYKYISEVDCSDLGGFPAYIYVCPFCDKKMQGLC